MPQPPKNKRNSAYWDQRVNEERKWISQNLANDEKFNAKLQTYYDNALRAVQDDIERELRRYAQNAGLKTVRGAKNRVEKVDIERFGAEAKKVVEKADRYRKENGGKSPGSSIYSNAVNQRMKLYNATLRINRLEAIKAQIGVEMADLGLELNHELNNKLTDDYVKQTIRSAGIFGDHVPKADKIRGKQASEIIMSQVGGGNWSDTVWRNTDELKARLDIALQKCMIEGKTAQQIARELRPLVSKEFKNAKYASERLARTESARVQANATLANLKRYGYDYCKWIAEPSACKVCASIADSDDGWGRGVYRVADVPDLPVHPNCRCAISAYWLDKPTISNFISDVKPTTFETSIDEVAELFRKIDIHTASKDDIIKLGQVFNKKYSISDKIGDKDAITKAVSVYRQTGGTVSEDKWVERSVKAVKSALNEAFNHYPTDWVNYLNNTSEVMFAGKNQRGFYIRALSDASGRHYKIPSWVKTRAELANYIEENNNGKYNTIYSSGRPTTAWHEIGHFVEDHNADVVRIEKEFVEERTKGEKPTKLADIYPSWRYRDDEVTKKDNFIDPYIGKTYPNATEVLSVGLESVFEPQNGHVKFIDKDGTYHYAKITDDPEYMDLILGLLLKG